MKVTYAGAQSWYRVDSHWDKSSYIVGSSWGPGIRLSTNWVSNKDNNGGTDLAKTYIFALGDGSGISMMHLTYSTVSPTTNSSAGAGSNSLVTSKGTYTNKVPDMLQGNFCTTSNLLLEGTTDASTLSTVVAAFSDGYKASSSMQLDQFFAGGVDGWRGTCIVYYRSDYVQDN